ncbi:MFS transporter [Leptolyngbya sp. BC1307]|uniref:MFS transporter n=1 Tax=Leptolyngbya sp. BC1307 TaxID=2029589 RepID=UPI000EFC520E|nr:MFS transporter [Leptolyngbya sp. BC1307]
MEFPMGLSATPFYATSWLAQLADPRIVTPRAVTPEEAALVFSGPQFFIALLSGVILAFGFQLLLTNLSMAAGVSYVSHSGSSSSSSGSSSSSSSGTGIKKISAAFGAWTLITVSLALFFACWLAVKLSLYNSVTLGAITGLVIWATYFTLLVWFSSTAVGSLVGSVVKSATNGFQALVGTATAALGAKTASNQLVETAEATAAAVRREFTTGLDTSAMQDRLQEYLSGLRSPEVDVTSIEQEFERLLRSSEIATAKDGDALPPVDSETFVKLLSDRTNLSRQETRRIANRLYRVWQRNTGGSNRLDEIMTFVASAGAGQLASEGLGSRLDQLVDELKQQRSQGQQKGQQSQGSGGNAFSQAMTQSLNAMIGMVMGKVDLSDFDANKVVGQIKSTQRELTGQSGMSLPEDDASDQNLIKADVENYLHHAYIGELKSPELEENFRNVLYDVEADETELREQISGISRKVFIDTLSARGLLTQTEVRDLANRLEVVRQSVLQDVITAETVASEKRVRQELETFFRFTPLSELSSDMGERAFRALIEDEPLDADYMRDRLGQISSDYFRQFLIAREDIDEPTSHDLANRYRSLLDRVIADADSVNQAAKVRLQQQQQSLEDYLRRTDKAELDPDGIKRDISALLNEPDQGIYQIRGRLARFDRDTLVKLLGQRPEFSEQEVDHVVSTIEESWNATISAPKKISLRAQAKYDEATAAIADYLRSTGKPELHPNGIQRDLQKLIDNPKVGAKAIRYRLSKMDRDTLVQLLSQRDDLSEAEANQAIDDVLSSIQGVIKAPRRLARRAQTQALSFQSALEDYLRNTDKEELNPTGIKRDLQLLLNDPKLGVSRLSDRLSQMDDSTMVALLAQRPDMTEAEATDVVRQVTDVRNQLVAQVRSIQRSVESVINRIFARIRQYLQSLDRPELDYYGIKSDVRTLFDDPQAGFSAMRDRLSQFDRDTLVALISSHDRVSDADANRVVDQIESARDGVLHRAERIEQQIEGRLSSIKAQTQQQMEDTKAAAEAAAWWLFGTALVSAVVAAIGGSLAVVG